MVSPVMTLMETTRLINVLLMSILLIFKLTSGLLGSEYLAVRTPPLLNLSVYP
jgi:hypothetical protein